MVVLAWMGSTFLFESVDGERLLVGRKRADIHQIEWVHSGWRSGAMNVCYCRSGGNLKWNCGLNV